MFKGQLNFSQIRSNTVSIKNAALAAAAMFELKSPSMLQFEDSANDETTYFQDLYKMIFSMAQRGKVFEGYRFLDDGDHGYLFDFVNQSEKFGTVHRHSIIRENVTVNFG